MRKIKGLIEYAIDHFGDSQSPRLDAEILLCKVLNVSKATLIAHSSDIPTEEQQKLFNELVSRRSKGEPIAYIVGFKEFYGRNFEVTSAVLIPRPETELLVEKALHFLNTLNEPKIIDLGTGSGCIAITIACELKFLSKKFHMTVADISSKALDIARRNAQLHKVDEEINFVISNWFQDIANDQSFNCIISNPPYIPTNDPTVGKEISFEPDNSLYSGNFGLDAIKEIISTLPSRLTVGGKAFIEFGFGQSEKIRSLVKSFPDLSILEIANDLAGIPRVVTICRVK